MAIKISAGTVIAAETVISGIDADSVPAPAPAPAPEPAHAVVWPEPSDAPAIFDRPVETLNLNRTDVSFTVDSAVNDDTFAYYTGNFGPAPTRTDNSFTVSSAISDDSFAYHTGLFGSAPTRTNNSFTVSNAVLIN